MIKRTYKRIKSWLVRINWYKVLYYTLATIIFLFWAVSIYLKMRHPFDFRHELRLQYFPNIFADWLTWILPALELLVLILLVDGKKQVMAFQVSNLILTVFNGYILFVLVKYFKNLPCSCAGLLNSWVGQLILNCFVIALAIIALLLKKKFSSSYQIKQLSQKRKEVQHRQAII